MSEPRSMNDCNWNSIWQLFYNQNEQILDEKRILISYSFYITFIFNEPKSILKKLIDIKKKVFIILCDLFSFTSALFRNVTPSKITQNY